jgi:S-adenosylmethionine decarboxylase
MRRLTRPPATLLARHHVVEFLGCDPARVDSVSGVGRALRSLCRAAPLHLVRLALHRFSPHGITYLCVLRESHLAYSSWPERSYCILSLQLCAGAPRLQAALAGFGRSLGARSVRQRSWPCGL